MAQLNISNLNPPINGKQYAYATSTGEVFDITGGQINQLSGSAADSIKTTYRSQIRQLENPNPTLATPASPNAGAAAVAPSNTPESADTGPNADNPYEGLGSPSALKDELKDFGDKNNFSALFKNLRYPTDLNDAKGQDIIRIQQIEYVVSPIGGQTTINEITSSLLGRESQFRGEKKIIKGSVYLPIPNELSETNQTGWGEDSLSAIAATGLSNLSGIAGKAASGNLPATVEGLKNVLGNAFSGQVSTRLNQFLAVNAAASALKFANINVNPEAYINRVTGTAINPNLELLFNGPKLRQFSFAFKLIPRSADEAKNIRSIIKFFKKGMAPRRSTVETKSIFLGTPNVFQVSFLSGTSDLKSIGKMKTCALVSCGVNYAPDGGYAAFEDPGAGGSQPVAIVLTLGFIELTPIYNDEYDAETLSDTIGPDTFDYTVVPTEGAGNPADNPRSLENARAQEAAEGRPLPIDIPISRTPGATGRSAGTSADLASGGRSGGV